MGYYYKERGEGRCPRCNSPLNLCQNSMTGGWFSSCTKCSYTGPASVYFETSYKKNR